MPGQQVAIETPLAPARPNGNVLPGSITADQLFVGDKGSSALPTSAPSSVASEQNSISSVLQSLSAPSVTNEDIQRALSPVVGGHSMQMPASLTTPIQNPPPVQLDHREVVGAGNARGQGIGNAISATVGALATFKATRDRAKQAADATKVSRLIQAQEAIDQAQQVLKQNPDDPAAKEALQHNTDVRNGLFVDDKFRQTVEKGFQISLTDPSKNKTPDHGIVQKGIDLFKKSKPNSQIDASTMGAKFASGMPQQLAPNVIAQQQLQYKIQQQQAYQKLVQAIVPRMITAENSNQRTQYVQGMMNTRLMHKELIDAQKMGIQFANQKELADLRHKYKLDEISTQVAQAGQKAMQLFQTEKIDPTVLFKEKTTQTNIFQQQEQAFNSAISDATQAMSSASAAMSKAGLTPEGRKAATDAYNQAKANLSSVQMQQTNHQKVKNTYYQLMGNLERISAGMSGGSNGSTTGQPTSDGSSTGLNVFDPRTLLTGGAFQYGGTSATTGVLPPVAGSGESESSDDEDNPDN